MKLQDGSWGLSKLQIISFTSHLNKFLRVSNQLKKVKEYINNDKVKLYNVNVPKKLPFEDKSFDIVYTIGVPMYIYPKDIVKVHKEIIGIAERYITRKGDSKRGSICSGMTTKRFVERWATM